MNSVSRRTFVRNSLASSTAAIGLSAATYARVAHAASAGPRPSLGFIGCGGRSKNLLSSFQSHADVRWACDPDKKRAESLRERAAAEHATTDLRHVLDDKSVEAVVVATPDHWHAPAAILACQAGKHVYVEKPCSHNLREGQLLVDAARKNKVVVQHGTQSRSNSLICRAIQLLREGTIGDVLMCKAWNVQRRRNIGHASPSSAPAHVDYDTWVGPAEYLPFQANRFHYDWHWWHNFGTGDIGNDGTHEMDIARWGLGVTGLPTTASAIGGKYYFDDDQQFPDTATCAFEWPDTGEPARPKQLIFEMRIWSKNYPYNVDTGVEFYGTRGLLFVSKRGKLQLWDDSNKPAPLPDLEDEMKLAKNHQVDFLEAITESRLPSADIAEGHASCSLVHLANISVRIGRRLSLDPKQQSILNDPAANKMLGRVYRDKGHWAIPQT